MGELAGWSEAKTSRIENGRTNPSPADIRAYCEHTHAADQLPDLLATLHALELAYAEWRKVLGTGTRKRQSAAVRLARESALMRIYQPQIIPGILQTAEYATAVLRKYVTFHRIPDDVDEGVSKRIERQQLLYSGNRKFHILIGEQALHTTVGDSSVMAGQLDRLLAVFGLSRVLVGIVPADAPMPLQATNFVMFDQRLVLVEGVTAELTITQPREIATYSRLFAELAELSVTGEPARAIIRACLAGYP